MLYYIVSNMNYKPAMRQIEKDINNIKKRSQEDKRLPDK